MHTALVGYTGFVGSNLSDSYPFEGLYNSKNIEAAYGTEPELLIYAGVRAEKFLANANPEQDYRNMQEALNNIEKIKPRKLVLISTIDVYPPGKEANENSKIETAGLQPYGVNRYFLECQVRKRYPSALIIRLPALFGKRLRKNFIYDYLHRIPSALTADKMNVLGDKIPDLKCYYHLQKDGFYKCMPLNQTQEYMLRIQFEDNGFTALNFTDSRNNYQFYHLKYLWGDLCKALKQGIPLLNITTEPLNTGELYRFLENMPFENHLSEPCADYRIKSIYANQMGGQNGYFYSKEQMMREIKAFVEENCSS